MSLPMTPDFERTRLERLWYMSDEPQEQPEWANDIEVYETEENGVTVVWFKDSGSKEWISSDTACDLEESR